MRIPARAFPALLALVLTLAVTMASRPALASDEGHFDRTLAVSGPVDLDVQTGSGEITVRVGDSAKVEVHGRIHANHGLFGGDVEQRIHEIEANPPVEQTGNTIRVGHIENRDWKNNISISYELVIPAQTKLHSESGSGDQSVDGISGPADGSSGSGSVRFSNIGAETHVRTGSGDIELNAIHGPARATAGSGGIRAIGIAGGLTASSGSGNVRLEQTAAGDVEIGTGSGDVEIKGAKGAVKVQTGSGSITAQGDPAGDWRLHTGSGNVSVELPQQAAFNLVARTSSGSIDSSREIAVQGKLSPRELEGKVGGGGPTVELSTSSGSIQIR
ncbi:MAG: DUF4097 family beta strand repeat-containing protein [Candidatus Acidiferrales bacterium]